MAESDDFLINGTFMTCNQGNLPARIIVTNGKNVNIKNQAAANQSDKTPVANIPVFGTCAILTQAANGAPTPCSHILGNWQGFKSDVNVGGEKALLKSSSITCTPIPGQNGKIEPT